LGCSSNPYHPQGIGSHDDYDFVIDKPKYSHLGKKIKYADLPPKVRYAVLSDYIHYWRIPLTEEIRSQAQKLSGMSESSNSLFGK